MKRIVLVLFCVSMIGVGHLQSEVLHLKDGSVLRGRLVKMDLDTLCFETSFGSKVMVHRDRVARIDFDESFDSVPDERPLATSALESAEPGTLSVSFEDFELSSRIVVERSGDRQAYERANAVEQTLLADGRKVHSVVDSLTDKTVRQGPETVLRNDFRPRAFEVALASGLHSCVVAFGNTSASSYLDRFDPAPLDKRLVLDLVRIEPGQTTHIRIGMKRKWTGKTELTRLE